MERTVVKFVIGKVGAVKMEAMNMKGEGCKDVTKDLEGALLRAGAAQTSSGDKPEIYENEELVNVSTDAWV